MYTGIYVCLPFVLGKGSLLTHQNTQCIQFVLRFDYARLPDALTCAKRGDRQPGTNQHLHEGLERCVQSVARG